MSPPLARCTRPTLTLHARPERRAVCTSQCLFGERVEILERHGDWCRVRGRRDGYAGYLAAGGLDESPDPSPPTHLVGVAATLLFAEPDIKSPVHARLPLGAELALEPAPDGPSTESPATPFAAVAAAYRAGHPSAYVWRAHCRAGAEPLPGTPVDVARRLFANTPYLWGGRTPDGADCSGLVQATAFALGLSLPRDSGEQERFLEEEVPAAARAASDLVFWAGHVGLLLDADTLFHATAHCLASVTEPLADVVERAGPPSSIRRLPSRPGPSGHG